jgi:carbon storage regulator
MLLLTRNCGKKIMIGDDIVVTVVNVHNKQVTLGISAPEYVSIHREEIYERIKLEQASLYAKEFLRFYENGDNK